jgi:hypothetical protein
VSATSNTSVLRRLAFCAATKSVVAVVLMVGPACGALYGSPNHLILRRPRSGRLEGWATSTVSDPHPSRRHATRGSSG